MLSSLGHRVGLMCAVGDDLAGRFVMNEASRRGLDVTGVSMVPGIATPVANMFVKLDGSHTPDYFWVAEIGDSSVATVDERYF